MHIEAFSEEEKKEIVKYGVERGKTIVIYTIITLILGYILGILYQSIIFLLSFSYLRRYAGGYHADSPTKCYIISFVLTVAALLSIKLVQFNNVLGIIIQTINLFIIMKLSPVENFEHKLDCDEKKKYGVRTKKIVLVLYTLYCIFNKMSITYLSAPIASACLLVGILLVSGYVKYRKVSTFTE